LKRIRCPLNMIWNPGAGKLANATIVVLQPALRANVVLAHLVGYSRGTVAQNPGNARTIARAPNADYVYVDMEAYGRWIFPG